MIKKVALTTLIALCSCIHHTVDSDKISSINIIDRNGISETIHNKTRLSAFEETDFFSPQPYQKVLRVYGRAKNGDVHSYITSYHPSGHIKQYLEVVNNRAYGEYKEWYASGEKKIEAVVVGGLADLNTAAEESWLFDGISTAFDEKGHVVAHIPYQRGELMGDAIYYHPSGQVWKVSRFAGGQAHGQHEVYLESGELLHITNYERGRLHGLSQRFWKDTLAYEEFYEKGKLMTAHYFDQEGEEISSIDNGCGVKALFGKNRLIQLQEYQAGIQEGSVDLFSPEGRVKKTYRIREGEKHGEESHFDDQGNLKLKLTWYQGELSGTMKTWYPSGVVESQRELLSNKKQGMFTAWYESGALMFVEEYDNDLLVKGEYYKEGNREPISSVEQGVGEATLYTKEGQPYRKIAYQYGKPLHN